jgi:neprilysin
LPERFIRANLIICFEQISLPNEKRRNATQLYNPKTIEELQKENPSVPWREYFSKILPPTVPIASDEVIIVNVPSYLGDLEKLLSNTPKRYHKNLLNPRGKLYDDFFLGFKATTFCGALPAQWCPT